MKKVIATAKIAQLLNPGDLPEGWINVALEEIGELHCGQSPSVADVNTIGRGTPYVTGPDQWDGKNLRVHKWTTDPRRVVPDGCVFITVKGAGVGTIFPGVKSAIGRDVYAFEPTRDLTYEFVMRALEVTIADIKSLAAGDIPGLSKNHILKHVIGLPPSREQQRIVSTIAALLDRVNTAHDHLAKVPKILKAFRQSVLAAACSGRLTEDWRELKSSDRDQWRQVALRDVADLRLGKMLDQVKNVGAPTPYLRNVNVRWFSFQLDDVFQMRATQADQREFNIQDGDLFVCEGGEPGRCAVWNRGPTNLIFQKAIHRVRLEDGILPHWVAFNLKKDADSEALDEYFTGSGIKHITGRSLAAYAFHVPPFEEQREIVRRVETLLKLADKIEARVVMATRRTDRLTQAILVKAFRGELVPTEAELARSDGRDYEHAAILLERIKAKRQQTAE